MTARGGFLEKERPRLLAGAHEWQGAGKGEWVFLRTEVTRCCALLTRGLMLPASEPGLYPRGSRLIFWKGRCEHTAVTEMVTILQRLDSGRMVMAINSDTAPVSSRPVGDEWISI